jgi:hypothetical protein
MVAQTGGVLRERRKREYLRRGEVGSCGLDALSSFKALPFYSYEGERATRVRLPEKAD